MAYTSIVAHFAEKVKCFATKCHKIVKTLSKIQHVGTNHILKRCKNYNISVNSGEV